MDKIDITTISTIRPKIIKQTFQSLKEHMCSGLDFRLIMDIAPVGANNGDTREDVMRVAHDFFPYHVFRTIKVSRQAEAQKWVWRTAASPYVIQWEDDWQLLRRVCVNSVCSIFADPLVAMVFFDREGKSVKDYKGYKGMFKQVDENLYQRTKYLNFGGPPAIVNREFISRSMPYLRDDECFDVTCERPDAQWFLRGWKFYVLTHPDGPYVRDLGKAWLKANGLKRKKRSSIGMQWIQD